MLRYLFFFKDIYQSNFWEKAFSLMQINRTPSTLLDEKSPYEVLHISAPLYNHLWVLGSLCFPKRLTAKTNKFKAHSRRHIFIGYLVGPKGSRVFDLETSDFFVSRYVIFNETLFPFTTSQPFVPKPIIQRLTLLLYSTKTLVTILLHLQS